MIAPDSQAAAYSGRSILAFIALTFAWAWGWGIAAAQIRADLPALSIGLQILSGFGPSLAGVAVVGFNAGAAGLRLWLVRCLNWRLAWLWYGLAFLTPPVIMVSAILLDAALGGVMPGFLSPVKIPLVLVNFGLVLLVGGPIGEEFGWRGYLTPALTSRMNWRTASLLLGVIWGIWHLPLFFMAGTPQATMGIAVYMVNILAGAVVFGWLFERSRESIVPCLVLHTSLNAWAGTLAIIPTETNSRPYLLVTGLLMLLAVALLSMPDSKSELAVTPSS